METFLKSHSDIRAIYRFCCTVGLFLQKYNTPWCHGAYTQHKRYYYIKPSPLSLPIFLKNSSITNKSSQKVGKTVARKKETSSVYDCTVEDIEYICNSTVVYSTCFFFHVGEAMNVWRCQIWAVGGCSRISQPYCSIVLLVSTHTQYSTHCGTESSMKIAELQLWKCFHLKTNVWTLSK